MEPLTAPSPTTPTAATTAQSVVRGDIETFLLMLTTQMRNQDPLKPIESSDFAVQLATFSGVEQQVRTNRLLEQLAGQGGISGLSQFAGWVGMEARVAAPVRFDGLPLALSPVPARGADRAVLVTLDARNQVVSREVIEPTGPDVIWAGTDADGAPFPPGIYSFRLESYRGDELIDTRPVETYSRISEVRNGADGPVIVLESGAVLPAASVTALRRAG